MSAIYKILYDILKYLEVTTYKPRHIQFLIFIVQGKLDLSYTFGWYGEPHSFYLENDVNGLFNILLFDENRVEYDKQNYRLVPRAIDSLELIKPILIPPKGITEEDWIESVATYLFLRKISKYSHREARDFMLAKKYAVDVSIYVLDYKILRDEVLDDIGIIKEKEKDLEKILELIEDSKKILSSHVPIDNGRGNQDYNLARVKMDLNDATNIICTLLKEIDFDKKIGRITTLKWILKVKLVQS